MSTEEDTIKAIPGIDKSKMVLGMSASLVQFGSKIHRTKHEITENLKQHKTTHEIFHTSYISESG